MRTIVVGLMLGLAGILGAAPAAAQDAAAGEAKAATCVACHGPQGNSVNPEWPKLAGQHADYTERQLKLFRDGKRVNALMSGMAANLSDQDIADLAAYYAAQTPTRGSANEDLVATAEAIFTGGDKERAIPACIACHGATGKGLPGAGYPALSGQHAVYTENVLTQFAGGEAWDGQGVSQIMVDIAGRLTEAEIQALSSFLQGLGGR